MTDNLLLIAASETNPDLYYASRFLAPDPFIYLKTKAGSFLLMSDLEVDRARAEAKVDRVLSYSDYEAKAKTNKKRPTVVEVVSMLLKEQGCAEVTVPSSFPMEYGDALRALGYRLTVKQGPFFEERAIKTEEEVAAIRTTQVALEEAVDEIIHLIREADIHEELLYRDGKALTSEWLRQRLHVRLMEKGCSAQHTIIACGAAACDPHHEGFGALRPHEPIVLDIFPRSIETRYFADMSRTVVKGVASDKIKRLYDTVLQGQELGISQVRAGANGREIHEGILAFFESRGYSTGRMGGRMQGFFHGTGHGVGLAIHEPPSISHRDCILQKGEVVTVEPGLYYIESGAVRIEDMVLVEEEGCRNLTTYPKFLEIE